MKRKDELKTLDVNAVAQASGGYHHHYRPGWGFGPRAYFGGYPYAGYPYAPYPYPPYPAPYYAAPGVVVVR
jgi:hypothetical protein